MDIKGQVTNKTAILDLLRDIFESSETGILVFTDGNGVERRLFFEDGAIVSAASTAPDESLGCLLVEKAIIHEHTLTSAEVQDGDGTTLMGQRLVDLGAVSEEEMKAAVRLKVKKTIQDILASEGGKVSFAKERLPDKARVQTSVDSSLLSSSIEELVEDNPSPSASEGESHAQTWLETSTAKLESPAEAEEDSAAALGGSTKPTETSDQQTAPRSTLLGISQLSGRVLVASCVLLAAAYWLFRETSSREPAEDHNDVPASIAPADDEVSSSVTIPPDTGLQDTTKATAAERADTKQAPAVQPSESRRTVTPEPPLSAEAASDVGPEVVQAPAVVEEHLSSPSAGERTEPVSETDREESAPSQAAPPASAPMATAATDSPASNPEAQLGDLVEPADDVIDPVLLELPKIHYPEQAKPQKLNVVVRVRVLVDERGYVVKAELQEPLGYGFDNAALSVAVRSRFIPATKGTVPVKMWTVLPIVYRFPKN